MTPPQRRVVAGLTALSLALAVALAWSLRRAWSAEVRASTESARHAEELRAREARLLVVEQDAADLAARAEELSGVRDQLAAAEKAIGKLRILAAVRLRGEPTPVTVERHPQPAGEPAHPPALLVGDSIRLGADLAPAMGEHGAIVLLGELLAWRVGDGALLARQTYSRSLSDAIGAPAICPTASPDRLTRYGLLGGISTNGWAAGFLISRRLDLWGYRPDAIAQAQVWRAGGGLMVGVAF